MKRNFLLIGYGAIGKRHARNLIELGIIPYILTKHPDKSSALFIRDINAIKGKDIEEIRNCIICSSTANHLNDFKRCVQHLNGLKNVLIEKPIESSYSKGKEIINIARRHKIKLSIAYNLRFLDAFDAIRKFIKVQRNKIKIVEVVAGQDLRQWRPDRHIRQSYSAHRKLGGGVDLDLSHEIDYLLWLFGHNFKDKLMYRDKISHLDIEAPDIFKLVLIYRGFIIDITLDYIREPKERYLKIICDNGKILFHNFINEGMDETYKKMLKVFLGLYKKNKYKLCSADQALRVLQVLEV